MSDFEINKIWFDLYTGDTIPDEDNFRTVIHTARTEECHPLTRGGIKQIDKELRKQLHKQLDSAIDHTNFYLEKLLTVGVKNAR